MNVQGQAREEGTEDSEPGCDLREETSLAAPTQSSQHHVKSGWQELFLIPLLCPRYKVYMVCLKNVFAFRCICVWICARVREHMHPKQASVLPVDYLFLFNKA